LEAEAGITYGLLRSSTARTERGGKRSGARGRRSGEQELELAPELASELWAHRHTRLQSGGVPCSGAIETVYEADGHEMRSVDRSDRRCIHCVNNRVKLRYREANSGINTY